MRYRSILLGLVLPGLFPLLPQAGCARQPLPEVSPYELRGGRPDALRPLAVSVRVVATDASRQSSRELAGESRVGQTEEAVLAIDSTHPVFFYVVHYADATDSALLLPRGSPLPGFGLHTRIPVARPLHATPSGVFEQRLFVVASEEPLDPALCEPLRLHCPRDPSAFRQRGNEEDKSRPPVKTKGVPEQPARPREEKPEKGRGEFDEETDLALQPLPAGVHCAVTVVPVILHYE